MIYSSFRLSSHSSSYGVMMFSWRLYEIAILQYKKVSVAWLVLRVCSQGMQLPSDAFQCIFLLAVAFYFIITVFCVIKTQPPVTWAGCAPIIPSVMRFHSGEMLMLYITGTLDPSAASHSESQIAQILSKASHMRVSLLQLTMIKHSNTDCDHFSAQRYGNRVSRAFKVTRRCINNQWSLWFF